MMRSRPKQVKGRRPDPAHLHPLDFGLRALSGPVTPKVLAREITRYDPRDAAEVSGRSA